MSFGRRFSSAGRARVAGIIFSEFVLADPCVLLLAAAEKPDLIAVKGLEPR